MINIRIKTLINKQAGILASGFILHVMAYIDTMATAIVMAMESTY
jgi:hypothetical protein